MDTKNSLFQKMVYKQNHETSRMPYSRVKESCLEKSSSAFEEMAERKRVGRKK
ncbi:hypothetical protein GFC29_58 [Anoxybacillus sp. B7M1]|jgi:hypothetical protein|uniref:Lacal_2735 family protein n=1 Tax=Anoxybacteroides rupiense TaxID=311460 RepID=A0ABD5IT33_9BACL|nr:MULTISPECIES: hypothetical protein [Anoxybacillus]ANB57336.1 hypothetical protein GFC28_1570 [Anoxybacillus sp. B2M1]ANB64013.1 hypothetical protein GFC29_58 [Anoxybacillus sp. B7M1]KXG09171.1 hypothetical protein AT864_02636 [Anoxybacillus sp. P3H1B]MBB3908711.1 hypothetical protein [Anoxybacillus rupiensis]MBS2770350.1 hypothetical protein [Anoxybacillus rupiensis]